MNEIITRSAEETKSLSKKLGVSLKGGEVLLLYGDLGAGKTTFVQGLAEGLGIKVKILSPTFVLRRFYHGRRNLAHFDFYRLESGKDLENLGIEEDTNQQTVVIIEWPDKVGYEREGSKKIYFEDVGNNERKILGEDLS